MNAFIINGNGSDYLTYSNILLYMDNIVICTTELFRLWFYFVIIIYELKNEPDFYRN